MSFSHLLARAPFYSPAAFSSPNSRRSTANEAERRAYAPSSLINPYNTLSAPEFDSFVDGVSSKILGALTYDRERDGVQRRGYADDEEYWMEMGGRPGEFLGGAATLNEPVEEDEIMQDVGNDVDAEASFEQDAVKATEMDIQDVQEEALVNSNVAEATIAPSQTKLDLEHNADLYPDLHVLQEDNVESAITDYIEEQIESSMYPSLNSLQDSTIPPTAGFIPASALLSEYTLEDNAEPTPEADISVQQPGDITYELGTLPELNGEANDMLPIDILLGLAKQDADEVDRAIDEVELADEEEQELDEQFLQVLQGEQEREQEDYEQEKDELEANQEEEDIEDDHENSAEEVEVEVGPSQAQAQEPTRRSASKVDSDVISIGSSSEDEATPPPPPVQRNQQARKTLPTASTQAAPPPSQARLMSSKLLRQMDDEDREASGYASDDEEEEGEDMLGDEEPEADVFGGMAGSSQAQARDEEDEDTKEWKRMRKATSSRRAVEVEQDAEDAYFGDEAEDDEQDNTERRQVGEDDEDDDAEEEESSSSAEPEYSEDARFQKRHRPHATADEFVDELSDSELAQQESKAKRQKGNLDERVPIPAFMKKDETTGEYDLNYSGEEESPDEESEDEEEEEEGEESERSDEEGSGEEADTGAVGPQEGLQEGLQEGEDGQEHDFPPAVEAQGQVGREPSDEVDEVLTQEEEQAAVFQEQEDLERMVTDEVVDDVDVTVPADLAVPANVQGSATPAEEDGEQALDAVQTAIDLLLGEATNDELIPTDEPTAIEQAIMILDEAASLTAPPEEAVAIILQDAITKAHVMEEALDEESRTIAVEKEALLQEREELETQSQALMAQSVTESLASQETAESADIAPLHAEPLGGGTSPARGDACDTSNLKPQESSITDFNAATSGTAQDMLASISTDNGITDIFSTMPAAASGIDQALVNLDEIVAASALPGEAAALDSEGVSEQDMATHPEEREEARDANDLQRQGPVTADEGDSASKSGDMQSTETAIDITRTTTSTLPESELAISDDETARYLLSESLPAASEPGIFLPPSLVIPSTFMDSAMSAMSPLPSAAFLAPSPAAEDTSASDKVPEPQEQVQEEILPGEEIAVPVEPPASQVEPAEPEGIAPNDERAGTLEVERDTSLLSDTGEQETVEGAINADMEAAPRPIVTVEADVAGDALASEQQARNTPELTSANEQEDPIVQMPQEGHLNRTATPEFAGIPNEPIEGSDTAMEIDEAPASTVTEAETQSLVRQDAQIDLSETFDIPDTPLETPDLDASFDIGSLIAPARSADLPPSTATDSLHAESSPSPEPAPPAPTLHAGTPTRTINAISPGLWDPSTPIRFGGQSLAAAVREAAHDEERLKHLRESIGMPEPQAEETVKEDADFIPLDAGTPEEDTAVVGDLVERTENSGNRETSEHSFEQVSHLETAQIPQPDDYIDNAIAEAVSEESAIHPEPSLEVVDDTSLSRSTTPFNDEPPAPAETEPQAGPSTSALGDAGKFTDGVPDYLGVSVGGNMVSSSDDDGEALVARLLSPRAKTSRRKDRSVTPVVAIRPISHDSSSGQKRSSRSSRKGKERAHTPLETESSETDNDALVKEVIASRPSGSKPRKEAEVEAMSEEAKPRTPIKQSSSSSRHRKTSSVSRTTVTVPDVQQQRSTSPSDDMEVAALLTPAPAKPRLHRHGRQGSTSRSASSSRRSNEPVPGNAPAPVHPEMDRHHSQHGFGTSQQTNSSPITTRSHCTYHKLSIPNPLAPAHDASTTDNASTPLRRMSTRLAMATDPSSAQQYPRSYIFLVPGCTVYDRLDKMKEEGMINLGTASNEEQGSAIRLERDEKDDTLSVEGLPDAVLQSLIRVVGLEMFRDGDCEILSPILHTTEGPTTERKRKRESDVGGGLSSVTPNKRANVTKR